MSTHGDVFSIQGFDPKICDNLKNENEVEIIALNVEYAVPRGKEQDIRFKAIRSKLSKSIANTPEEITEAFDFISDNLLLSDLTLTK